jgi:hypothetical protein
VNTPSPGTESLGRRAGKPAANQPLTRRRQASRKDWQPVGALSLNGIWATLPKEGIKDAHLSHPLDRQHGALPAAKAVGSNVVSETLRSGIWPTGIVDSDFLMAPTEHKTIIAISGQGLIASRPKKKPSPPSGQGRN